MSVVIERLEQPEVIVAKQEMTFEDLMHLPEDGYRHELTKGELLTMIPTGGQHGLLALRLGGALAAHIDRHQLGLTCAAETGFILSRQPDTVRAPDVSFISRDRVPSQGVPEGYWDLAPDLAVEVVSPSDSASDVRVKIREFLEAGTHLVWVVYPRLQVVEVHYPSGQVRVLGERDVLDGEDVVAGFSYSLAELFAGL